MPGSATPAAMSAATLAGSVYERRRGELEAYFDRTAAAAWARLTSEAPLGRIRRTVRAGRDEMRATLLSWLPEDLAGCRVLDAGCGTGALAVAAARRGAQVVAIDLAGTLLELAVSRMPADVASRIELRAGDMLDPAFGRFDYVVAMDSLIHYPAAEMADAIGQLADRTDRAVLTTLAPRTPMLAAMHAAGRLFPRADRAPAIEPISPRRLRARLAGLPGFRQARRHRVSTGFYISEANELVRG